MPSAKHQCYLDYILMRAAERFNRWCVPTIFGQICGNYLPVYLGSDNAGPMEGKNKHGQVGTSTKEFINKEKINTKHFLFPCGKS